MMNWKKFFPGKSTNDHSLEFIEGVQDIKHLEIKTEPPVAHGNKLKRYKLSVNLTDNLTGESIKNTCGQI